MRPHGRASVSTRNPRAFAICDNCGFLYNHDELRWQFDWAGNKLINKRQLVCRRCNDLPQNQLRAIVLPADPVPVMNPRTQNYQLAADNTRQTSSPTQTDPYTGLPLSTYQTSAMASPALGVGMRITEDTDFRSTQVVGAPNGSLNQLPGTDPNAVTYRVISNTANNGSGVIRLTIDTTNGMITGQYITVREVTGTTEANGNWYITVINTNEIDLNGSAYSNSYISGGYAINNPALPYNFNEVPRTGPQ